MSWTNKSHLGISRHVYLVLLRHAKIGYEIVVHKLPIKPKCKPIKQKFRRIKSKMLLKIKKKAKKQFEVGFLVVAKYAEWVAILSRFLENMVELECM